MQAIRLTLPTEEAAQQSPATKKAKAGTGATAFPSILSGVQRASGTAAEGGGRAAQRLVLGGEGAAGLEGTAANGEEGGLAALFGGALLRAGDGEGKAQKRILLASEGGTASGTGPSASAETVKLMPILHAAGGKNAAGGENTQGGENVGSLVVRAVRAGKQTAGQAGGEGGNASSSGQKTEGGTQVRVSWGRVAFTSGDGTARSAQQGQKTVPVVKGAGGTEGGAQQTARQGASGGRGAGANGASSSGTGSGRAKQVQVSPGTIAAESGEGRSGQGADGQPSKGKGPVRRMPEGERAGASARKGGRGPGQEGTLLSGEKRRPGQNAGRSSRPNGVRSEGQARGDAGRPQDAGSRAGGSAKKDGTRGKQIAPSALKGGGAESGRGQEGTDEGRTARTARDGARSTGRRGRGRSGQRGGTGQQGGGQQGQGPGQNGQGQKGQTQGAKNGPGFQALASSSTSTSGESDARTLRASLTQDGASTGNGTQTDGKGANASGGGSGAASKAKADARPTGKSGPPRTMPSAWLNAAKNGPLRTAELAGGWKALEMSLGEDKGTMTVKARQGQEQTAVSVGFSDTRVQAQVTANARQLQDAMQAQYGTDVDLSFSGGDANESDQQASDGASSEGASALAPGDESTDADESSGASLRGRGRREWIG
ncbi:hypothetical protein [Salinibacter ruber]|uniref:hypothetical protein n=1 Tax=Salinibacter ruber TaxID=146919 RepID=UPI0021697CE9|nr:hypothetical protein [Salinibacter ruber]MCS3640264.1 hypothetical protein [Salinibacter ruber]